MIETVERKKAYSLTLQESKVRELEEVLNKIYKEKGLRLSRSFVINDGIDLIIENLKKKFLNEN